MNSLFIDSNKSVANKKQTPEKGPVMLLYELFNDVQIDCVSSDGVQHSRFKMVATVNNQKFEGTGIFHISTNFPSNYKRDRHILKQKKNCIN